MTPLNFRSVKTLIMVGGQCGLLLSKYLMPTTMTSGLGMTILEVLGIRYVHNTAQQVPYAYNHEQWVGYDNSRSVRNKVCL